MCPLHNPHLVCLHGGVWNEGADKLCIVLEFCANGSLKTFLADNPGSWKGGRHGLAVGTARGIAYLHHELAEPLIHRDIKPDNVLVSADVVAKLADFGESTYFDVKLAQKNVDEVANDALSPISKKHARLSLTMTMVGTKLYCAPEITMRERYNESADTFSFALVLLCLAVGDIRFVWKRRGAISQTAYATGWRPSIPKRVRVGCPDVAKLITEMWDGDFNKRPALKEVVRRLEAASVAALGCEIDAEEDEENYLARGGAQLPGGGAEGVRAQLAERDARISDLEAEIAKLREACYFAQDNSRELHVGSL